MKTGFLEKNGVQITNARRLLGDMERYKEGGIERSPRVAEYSRRLLYAPALEFVVTAGCPRSPSVARGHGLDLEDGRWEMSSEQSGHAPVLQPSIPLVYAYRDVDWEGACRTIPLLNPARARIINFYIQ